MPLRASPPRKRAKGPHKRLTPLSCLGRECRGRAIACATPSAARQLLVRGTHGIRHHPHAQRAPAHGCDAPPRGPRPTHSSTCCARVIGARGRRPAPGAAVVLRAGAWRVGGGPPRPRQLRAQQDARQTEAAPGCEHNSLPWSSWTEVQTVDNGLHPWTLPGPTRHASIRGAGEGMGRAGEGGVRARAPAGAVRPLVWGLLGSRGGLVRCPRRRKTAPWAAGESGTSPRGRCRGAQTRRPR